MTTPGTTHTRKESPLELHDILARLQYQGGNTPNERNRANRRATEEIEELLQQAYERGKAAGAVEEELREQIIDIVEDIGTTYDDNREGYSNKAYTDRLMRLFRQSLASQEIRRLVLEARLSERKEVALDNYQGQTFSDSTNWHGKYDKFVENNEKRIKTLKQQLAQMEEEG